MAEESVTKNWGHRKDMIQYWKPENHKTKQVKSKKKSPKKHVSHYDILAGPQKWMLLESFQQFDDSTLQTITDGTTFCTVHINTKRQIFK